MRRPLDLPLLRREVNNRRITAVRRRGKYLLLDTEPAGSLLVHLGMSGRMLLAEAHTPRLPHTHLVLRLESGPELRLVDPRRFGFAQWLNPGDEATDPSLSTLGMEPLAPDTKNELPPLLHARKSPIKTLLLDQRLVAGVGNIYAVESLWRAGIRPSRQGARIAMTRLDRLVREVQEVLCEAIEQGGTTIRDFSAPGGNFGYFAVRLQAYGRAGAPCSRCATELREARIGGRSTPFCPQCQR